MAAPVPRPWFRLGSFTRPTAATTTTPVPEQPRPVPARIRPLLIRPAAVSEPSLPAANPKQQSADKSPPRPAAPQTPLPKKEASPPPPPAANALVTKPVFPSPSSGDTATVKPGSPTQSDQRHKDSSQHPSPVLSRCSPMSIPSVPSPYDQSPKLKAATPLPPSPLLLPPPLQSDAESTHETIPQEVERKTVVFQKVMEKPASTQDERNGKQELKKNDIKKEKEKGSNGPKKSEEKDSNTRFITMTGENRGASMEVILSSDKNNNKNIESQNEDKESKNKSTGTGNNVRRMKAFCNSNVQGINNSILMNSKFSHHDPGIHLVFSTMPSVDDGDEEQQ